MVIIWQLFQKRKKPQKKTNQPKESPVKKQVAARKFPMDKIYETDTDPNEDYEVKATTSKQIKIDGDKLATVSTKNKTYQSKRSQMKRKQVATRKFPMDKNYETDTDSDTDWELNAMTSKRSKIDGDNLATYSEEKDKMNETDTDSSEHCGGKTMTSKQIKFYRDKLATLTTKKIMYESLMKRKQVATREDKMNETDTNSDTDCEVNAMTSKRSNIDGDNLATDSEEEINETDTNSDTDSEVDAMTSKRSKIDGDNSETNSEEENGDLVILKHALPELLLQIFKLKSGISVDSTFRDRLNTVLGNRTVKKETTGFDIAKLTKENAEKDAAFLERVKNGEEVGFRGFEKEEVYEGYDSENSNEQELE